LRWRLLLLKELKSLAGCQLVPSLPLDLIHQGHPEQAGSLFRSLRGVLMPFEVNLGNLGKASKKLLQ
jgi:hypothetical protein